jgi:hypothetical protein
MHITKRPDICWINLIRAGWHLVWTRRNDFIKDEQNAWIGLWYASLAWFISIRKINSHAKQQISDWISFLCRGSAKPAGKCSVTISDLVFMYNKATEGQAKNEPVGFDLFDGLPSEKKAFIKFCKPFEHRLRNHVAIYRIIPADEQACTDISIPGFIVEVKKSLKGKHTLGPLKISLQFLENHKTQYLELHRELLKLEYSPQTDAALQNFKTLCLLEISLLMGFDIDWGTGDGGELSGAPVLPAGAKVLPAGASADDKDHSDEDVPLLTPRDSASANAAAAAGGARMRACARVLSGVGAARADLGIRVARAPAFACARLLLRARACFCVRAPAFACVRLLLRARVRACARARAPLDEADGGARVRGQVGADGEHGRAVVRADGARNGLRARDPDRRGARARQPRTRPPPGAQAGARTQKRRAGDADPVVCSSSPHAAQHACG